VVRALGCLDPSLHCGPALATLGLDQPAAAGTDYLLITDAEAAQQPALSQRLAAAQPGLRYLLTVSRAGALELFEYQNGHRTLLSTSRYDLDELLTARRTRRTVPTLPPLVGPAFLNLAFEAQRIAINQQLAGRVDADIADAVKHAVPVVDEALEITEIGQEPHRMMVRKSRVMSPEHGALLAID
nr:hypothetical protein [Tanacetum cinerariifolium]